MASKLTQKQTSFIKEYLVDLNGAAAARRAGYSAKNADVIANRLMQTPHVAEAVRQAIEERNARVEVSQDRIIEELRRIAFNDIRSVATWDKDGILFKDSNALHEEDAATVAEIAQTREGLRLKRHDKTKALELLMRHLGMLNDRMKFSVSLDTDALREARERVKDLL